MEGNAVAQLETWLYEHKSHSASIWHDDGYGAGPGWVAELWGKYNVKIFVCEQSANHEHIMVGTKENDWPGLEAVLTVAIKTIRERETEGV